MYMKGPYQSSFAIGKRFTTVEPRPNSTNYVASPTWWCFQLFNGHIFHEYYTSRLYEFVMTALGDFVERATMVSFSDIILSLGTLKPILSLSISGAFDCVNGVPCSP